eukprot:scaffold157565_cov50-Cyclotella_meneghiniana.AAC.1
MPPVQLAMTPTSRNLEPVESPMMMACQGKTNSFATLTALVILTEAEIVSVVDTIQATLLEWAIP